MKKVMNIYIYIYIYTHTFIYNDFGVFLKEEICDSSF